MNGSNIMSANYNESLKNVYNCLIKKRLKIINIPHQIHRDSIDYQLFLDNEILIFLEYLNLNEEEEFYVKELNINIKDYIKIYIQYLHERMSYCLIIYIEDIRLNFNSDKIDKFGSVEQYLKYKKMKKTIDNF